MWSYEKRLARDIARWRSAGWVTAEGERAILAELARGSGAGLANLLAVLGAVLLGFAAMSFVAANWQDMSKLVRLMVLLGGLWSAYGLAGILFSRGLSGFAHAAILLAIALFGASIMLIAQMYHIDGNPPDAVLIWGAGALVAGLVLRSNPALAVALLCVGLWAGWETALREDVFWPFLAGWAAVTGAFAWRQWRPGLHLSAMALTVWLISLGYLLGKGHAHELVVMLGLVVVGAAIAAERFVPRFSAEAPIALGYGILVTYSGLFALQFVESPGTADLVLLAIITLVYMIAAVAWGWRTGHKPALWLGYAGFSIEILSLYFKTVGSLLGSSLFFLVAGIIVVALAAAAYRLHARGEPQAETSA